jgi:hypothetical protein
LKYFAESKVEIYESIFQTEVVVILSATRTIIIREAAIKSFVYQKIDA